MVKGRCSQALKLTLHLENDQNDYLSQSAHTPVNTRDTLVAGVCRGLSATIWATNITHKNVESPIRWKREDRVIRHGQLNKIQLDALPKSPIFQKSVAQKKAASLLACFASIREPYLHLLTVVEASGQDALFARASKVKQVCRGFSSQP